MTRSLILVLGGTLLGLSPFANAAGTFIVDVKSGCLYLRASPNARGKIRDCLDVGEPLTVLSRTNSDWIRVRSEDGVEGYVSSRYLTAQGGGPKDKPVPQRPPAPKTEPPPKAAPRPAPLPEPAPSITDTDIVHRGAPLGSCRKIAAYPGYSVQNPACLPNNKIAVNVMNDYNGAHSEMHIVDPVTKAHSKVKTLSSATSYTGHITRRGAGGKLELLAQCPGDILCIFDLEGHKCPIAGTNDGEEATFSPDGRHIVYDHGGKICVTAVNPDIRAGNCSAGQIKCSEFGGKNTQPDWSPLGNEIVFQRKTGGKQFQVAKMKVSNGVPDWNPQILETGSGEGTDTSFGPDGSIVYSSGSSIYKIPRGGGRPRKLLGTPRGYNGANVLCGDYVYFEHRDPGTGKKTSVYQCDARFEGDSTSSVEREIANGSDASAR